MTDHEVFETRLRTALDRYVAGGPTEFDAFEFARTVVGAEPRRHGHGITFGWPRVAVPRLFWIVLATALLLAALVASALLVGSRPEQRPASWQRIDLPGAADGTYAQMTSVVRTPTGYLAVGDGYTYVERRGHVWTSRDGVTWDLVATGDMFTNTELKAVTRNDEGYVAVGVTDPPSGHAAVWLSADGQTWRSATAVADADGAFISDVAFADGRYVAVGGEFIVDSYFDFVARAWVSDDADHWTPAASTTWSASAAGDLSAVVAGGPGFVATGRARGVWTSPDGDAWRLVLPSEFTPAVLVSDDVAVGYDGRILVSGGRGLVRTSDDMKMWVPHWLPERSYADELTASHDVTSLATATWGYAALWANELGGPVLLWTSRDGTSWLQRDLTLTPALTVSSFGYPTLLGCGDALIVSTDNMTWRLPTDTADLGL